MKRANLARIPPADDSLDLWATRITSALQKTVEGIFETGQQLLAAREKLPHGEWERLFTERRVPMSVHSARMFIEIYKRRTVLANRDQGLALPHSWRTLYALSRLPDDTLEWAHAHGKITPDMERPHIKRLCAEYAGAPIIDVTPVAPLPEWNTDHAFNQVNEALQAVRALIDRWPDDQTYRPLLHELRQLLKFVERVEAREHGPEVSA